jgi:hypothetical protein
VSRQLALGLEAVPCKSPRPRAFFVRGHATVAQAALGQAAAEEQDARVLALFRAPGLQRLTPWDVAEALRIPITSARRACTTLTKAGLLVHHRADRRRSGPYGALSATWSAA